MRIEMHTVEDREPRNLLMLFSLPDMDGLKLFFNNTTDALIHRPDKASERVSLMNGHAF